MGSPVSAIQDEQNPKTTPKRELTIESTYTQELVLGLCGPIGSPIHQVANICKNILETQYRYSCIVIRISDFIREEMEKENPGSTVFSSEFERLKALINNGDKIRKKYKRPSILAEMAIKKISTHRYESLEPELKEKLQSDKPIRFPPRRVCYLIDSIKNQKELEILQNVYQDLFYFIGVYASQQKRKKNLEHRSMRSYEADLLIDMDAGETGDPVYGQTVRKTFPLADLFVRADSASEAQIRHKLERFLHLVFNTEIITPTPDETAMYLAQAAAGSSACLSRQVGACLTDAEGNVLSVGWNDVPKAHGHLYQSTGPGNDDKDHRCKNMGGRCKNDEEKEQIATEIANELIKNKLISQENKERTIDVLLKTRLKSIIEFSRAIHAEMFALITAAENCGSKIREGTIYCTTYPCHNCARHLIAAGIMKIYYIEPYPKSLATKLHDDSITEDENDVNKVRILAFDGISPNKYLHFFTYLQGNRKGIASGTITPGEAKPKREVTLESIPVLEGIIVKNLKEVIDNG